MLFAIERRWAEATLSAFAPPGSPGLAPRDGEVDWMGTVDVMMAASTPRARLGMRVGLLIVAFAPFWLAGRLATIAKLGVEARAGIVERLSRHRVFFVRELTMLLKIGAAMALLGAPSVRARSRYDELPAAERQRAAAAASKRVRSLPVFAPGVVAPSPPPSPVMTSREPEVAS